MIEANSNLFGNYIVARVDDEGAVKRVTLKDGPTLRIPTGEVSGLIDKLQGEKIRLEVGQWPPKRDGNGIWIQWGRHQIYPVVKSPVRSAAYT